MRFRAKNWRWRRLPGWIALVLGGCAAVSAPQTQIATGRVRFESASLSYRTDPVPAQPLPAESSSGIHLAAFNQPLPQPATPQPLTRLLQIKYPHPAGRGGYALVELVLGSTAAKPASSWSGQLRQALRESMPGMNYGEGIAEAWALDVPAAEIDQLLVRLEEQGYFTAVGPVPTAGTLLSAKIDGAEFQRPWQRCDSLETLISRVRHEGKLVSHPQPLEPPPAPAGEPATLPWAPAPVSLTRLPPIDPAELR